MKTSFEFCTKVKYEHAYTVQNHIHPCYEIVYYIEGEGYTQINNKNYKEYINVDNLKNIE